MAKQDHTVTKDLLHRIFDYKDGNLYWKSDRVANKVAGSIAGHKDPKGYVIIVLNKIKYRAHRLIYIMFNGYTNHLIDHINGNKSDNRIENLRAATYSENLKNAKISKSNSSGLKNVSNYKGRWRVRLMIEGKGKVIGSFDDLELAGLVASMAREKYHGKFANHG